MKQTKKMNNQTIMNNIKKFIKSQNMILLIFMLFILFLIGYSRTIIKSERMFLIESNDKKVVFKDGLVITNYKTHYFLSPKIKYSGKDVILKNYTAGYYIGSKKVYEIKNNSGKKEFSLKSVIENENFNVYEPRKNAVIFTKKTLNRVEKMKFKLVGKTSDNSDYTLEIPLVVSEI